MWRAVDETLDQAVQVQLLPAHHPRTPGAIEAARLASVVEDARLVRVLDVGHEGELPFLVRAVVPGRSLVEVLTDGPLPAETVRRLVGEAAQALTRAGTRGLHHQRLTPECLVISTDGSVTLLGTGVDAALAGTAPADRDVAARTDAVGLVSVLYAGLTGRWPGSLPSALPPAPLAAGRCVPPADLVAAVPGDLDALCGTTLGPSRQGPHSPAELAERLAPWAGIEPLTNPRGLHVLGPARPGAGADDTVSGLPTLLPRSAEPAPPPPPPPLAPALPPAAPAAASPPPPAAGATSFDLRSELLESEVSARGRRPATTQRHAGRTATTADAPPPTPSTPAARAFHPATGGQRLERFDAWANLSDIGTPAPEQDTLVPFVGPVPVERPPGEQSRFVIVVVVGFVILVLLAAAFSLRDFGSGGGLTARPTPSTAAAPTSAAATAPPATTPAATATTVTTPTPSIAASPDIAGIQAIDPHGDGSENGDQARRAIDGDPKTVWRSNYYATAAFAGLKDGLGLALDLGTTSTVQQVTISVAGSGGKVELRTATGPGIDGSTRVAEADIDGGMARLTPAQPVATQWVVLWFTKLPRTGGQYRLIVSEIEVR